MFKKPLLRSLFTILSVAVMPQTSQAQSAVQFEIIDVSIQNCLGTWASNGASDLSRKSCLGALATPTVKFKYALSDHGEQNEYTQHIAYSLLRVNHYIVESYVSLIGDGTDLSWSQTLCEYNDDALKFSKFSFSATKPSAVKYAKKIGPRHEQIAKVCADVPKR